MKKAYVSQSSVLKKKKSPTRKWAKSMHRLFTEVDTKISDKHKKRCSTSLAIREMQISATDKISLHSYQNG